MTTSSDLLALLLTDTRLPVAGHTQSGTLEGAVMAGLGVADVPGYLVARLSGVTQVEAGTAVVARAVVTSQGPLAAVERAWAARTVSPALRAASRVQGQALLRLAGRLWPEVPELVDPVERPSRAVVLGALGAHLGLTAAHVARQVAYDDVQTVCAAALKLLPLDPAQVTGWVVDAMPAMAATADAVTGLTDPAHIPSVAVPQIEAWAQAHARTTRRLFRA
ncbi:MAG TPA: urease accessory UreF family protein [Nocardioides sp.]|nr:urease accessory UreF family protein [Nocardioides sp.]